MLSSGKQQRLGLFRVVITNTRVRDVKMTSIRIRDETMTNIRISDGTMTTIRIIDEIVTNIRIRDGTKIIIYESGQDCMYGQD